jgi:ribosomal protein S18 acetylase RimI-like enzyme
MPILRSMTLGDVDGVVAVHLQAFRGFFLSFLGPRFLKELYVGILGDPSGIAFVVEGEGGSLLGFVAGSDRPAGLYRRLIRHRWWRFAAASIGALVRRPAIAPRLVWALRLPRDTAALGNHALLMSIGVAPNAQGGGAGRLLIDAFLKEAGARGSETVVLTTDRRGNDAVNEFYRRAGFQLTREYVTREGREMNEYEFRILDPTRNR